MSEVRRRYLAGGEGLQSGIGSRRATPSPRPPRSPRTARGLAGFDDVSTHPLGSEEDPNRGSHQHGPKQWWLFATMFTPFVSIVAKLAHAVGIVPPTPKLTPAQVVLLEDLRAESLLPFEVDNVEHQLLLHELWRLAYPGKELPGLRGPHWRDMGWQGDDPVTDLRTAGHLSMRQLVSLGMEHPDAFHKLLHKKDGTRSEWEYPFAIAGVNLTYMLIDALGILPVALGRSKHVQLAPCVPFLKILQREKKAFTTLYALCFSRLDREWIKSKASYMQFNEIMIKTRCAVEKALNSKPEPRTMAEVQRRLRGP